MQALASEYNRSHVDNGAGAMKKKQGKLMEMLTGYAASHQHPVNVFVHMIGIPTIMLGALIPLTWVQISVDGFKFDLAQAVVVGFFLFYLTLDAVFALAFLVLGLLVAQLAAVFGDLPFRYSGTIAAAAFLGGYAAQFIGHAVERSMPVLVRHPIQANLAAPFFQVVEMFKLLGLRDELFNEVQRQIATRKAAARERT
jgi:2-hydroxy fatty acid dioxygenase